MHSPYQVSAPGAHGAGHRPPRCEPAASDVTSTVPRCCGKGTSERVPRRLALLAWPVPGGPPGGRARPWAAASHRGVDSRARARGLGLLDNSPSERRWAAPRLGLSSETASASRAGSGGSVDTRVTAGPCARTARLPGDAAPPLTRPAAAERPGLAASSPAPRAREFRFRRLAGPAGLSLRCASACLRPGTRTSGKTGLSPSEYLRDLHLHGFAHFLTGFFCC